jgi:hypothetical protein
MAYLAWWLGRAVFRNRMTNSGGSDVMERGIVRRDGADGLC